MFENIRVIAADIDGTLTPTAQIPSRYTIETIDELREKGYLFGLAGRRPSGQIPDLAGQVPV